MPDARRAKARLSSAETLIGEDFAYQLLLFSDDNRSKTVSFEIEADVSVSVYLVRQTAVLWPHYSCDTAPNYLLDTPGLLPDCLIPIGENTPLTVSECPVVLWLETCAAYAGDHSVLVRFHCGEECCESLFRFHTIDQALPKQWYSFTAALDPIRITKAHGAPLFCSTYWDILDRYFALAAEHGVTEIVMPLFPMKQADSAAQLIKVRQVKDGMFDFDYDLFDTWILCARQRNIIRFTVAPFFPSLKTLRCPAIQVYRYDRPYPLFDDSINILSPEYSTFLRKFLRNFIKHLKEIDLIDGVSFQLAGEGSVETAEVYRQCRDTIRDLLGRFRIVDVYTDPQFYFSGMAASSAVSLGAIAPIAAEKPNGLRTCFDIHSTGDIVNQLIAAPAVRLRALGILCYRYDIVGFLSREFMLNTGNAYPTGSDYLVYSEPDGPFPSIRLKLLWFALQDLRVLELLEQYTSRERVLSLIERKFPVTFDHYPADSKDLLSFRREVTRLLGT